MNEMVGLLWLCGARKDWLALLFPGGHSSPSLQKATNRPSKSVRGQIQERFGACYRLIDCAVFVCYALPWA